MLAVQVVDSVGQGTCTTAGKTGAVEEEGEPSQGFARSVEVGDDVEDGREGAGLEDTQEQSADNQAAEVVRVGDKKSDKTKEEDHAREPRVGLDDLDEVVGHDLEDDVEDKEDSQCGGKLVAVEVERLFNSVHLGVGDVHPVEERKEVEEAEGRNDAHVDLPHELALVDAAFLGESVHPGLLLLQGELEVCHGPAGDIGGRRFLVVLDGGLCVAALAAAGSIVRHACVCVCWSKGC